MVCEWRVPDWPAFHLPDVSVTVMRPPPHSVCSLLPAPPPTPTAPHPLSLPGNVFCMCFTVWPLSSISQIYGKLDALSLPAATNIRSR